MTKLIVASLLISVLFTVFNIWLAKYYNEGSYLFVLDLKTRHEMQLKRLKSINASIEKKLNVCGLENKRLKDEIRQLKRRLDVKNG